MDSGMKSTLKKFFNTFEGIRFKKIFSLLVLIVFSTFRRTKDLTRAREIKIQSNLTKSKKMETQTKSQREIKYFEQKQNTNSGFIPKPQEPKTIRKIIIEDVEYTISLFKVVCYWKEPRKNKDNYVYSIDLMRQQLDRFGIYYDSMINVVRAFVRLKKDECKKIFVFDNRPNSPSSLIGYYENGTWIKLTHPHTELIKTK